jgi:hypothetical protein
MDYDRQKLGRDPHNLWGEDILPSHGHGFFYRGCMLSSSGDGFGGKRKRYIQWVKGGRGLMCIGEGYNLGFT